MDRWEQVFSYRTNLHKFCTNSGFSHDVTAAMLVYRTIAKKFFWEFDSIIMQNLSDILPLFFIPTWPSYHVSENQEFAAIQQCSELPYMGWRVVCTGDANAAQKTNAMQLMTFSHMVLSLISDTLHFGWVNDLINAPGGVYTGIIIRLIVTCAIFILETCLLKGKRGFK